MDKEKFNEIVKVLFYQGISPKNTKKQYGEEMFGFDFVLVGGEPCVIAEGKVPFLLAKEIYEQAKEQGCAIRPSYYDGAKKSKEPVVLDVTTLRAEDWCTNQELQEYANEMVAHAIAEKKNGVTFDFSAPINERRDKLINENPESLYIATHFIDDPKSLELFFDNLEKHFNLSEQK